MPEAAPEVVAVGGDLEVATLLSAYRHGLFPMPVSDGDAEVLCWWLPWRRGIIDVGTFVWHRSVRRARRDFEIRVDAAFDAVLHGCADPARPHGWITPEIEAAYQELHRQGHAHSVEAWRDGQLCGGLYGVAINGLFAAESKFHHVSGASKAAVAGLVELLAAAPQPAQRLIDTQWSSPHLASLGVIDISRREYAARLERALLLPSLEWSVLAADGRSRAEGMPG